MELDGFGAIAPAELEYLRWCLERIRRLENTGRARFAETLVRRRLDGAAYPDGDWEPWNLRWHDLKLEVKCSGARQTRHADSDPVSPASWTVRARMRYDEKERKHVPPKQLWADIYVLARHEGWDLAAGWRFHVLSRSDLIAVVGPQGGRCTATRLERHGFQAIRAAELPEAVTKAGLLTPDVEGFG